MTIAQFRKIVWKHYEKNGRHTLPWRKTHDPYKVLVSEIMLQQTQVERVIPYFNTWMKKYPTGRSLAAAPLKDVLTLWQGLGYNRRAKMLHEAAKVVAKEYKGKMPQSVEALEALPGIGHYTARAVAAFAYNQDVVFVETNLRTIVFHHFFSNKENVHDTEVLEILARALPKGNARDWYAALMDYGSFLKRSGIRVNAKKKGYIKQSAFEGSGRQVRGAILRELSHGQKTKAVLSKLFNADRREQFELQLARLVQEGMIERRKATYSLPE